MKLDKFNEYVGAAALAPNLELLVGATPVPFPYFDVVGKSSSFCMAYVGNVKEILADGEVTQHTVVAAVLRTPDGEDDYAIWCGDKFIEARDLSVADANQRCVDAVGEMPGRNALVKLMMESYNKQKMNDRCGFWTAFRREKKLCNHTNALLAHLRDNVPGFQDKLNDSYQSATSGAVAGTPIGETLSLEELAFRVPVLIEGERGSGKTVDARAFCRTNKYRRVEMGGHAGIEAPDLLGFLVPHGKDTMVWKDGPIAEAFRSAKNEKTVLIIDELLRIRERELSILLTALSPDEGVYRLRTGRVTNVVDGVASEEELECPVENLCVIATTNVGSEYAVDEIDAALAERFVPIRKDTNVDALRVILTSVAAKHKLPKTVVKDCVNFFLKMTEARNRGLVCRTPTTRTLVRSLELAKNVDDVRRLIKSQVLLWVARTTEGHPVPEQVADVNKTIERCFGVK